ncbi:aldo/keto reductase [Bifidobacterium scaligerum]|uniref:Oxidoreductase n=1 Tax=Bifidobacterium scaligerum TaxID=2052656 RepID=A0A2M9HRT1_9BIFI|nr:aldo/keto reductase [Bifidobacterium scaligerum]PJM79531.1 oxidoreductase [Bifidobacterium scaligerum]
MGDAVAAEPPYPSQVAELAGFSIPRLGMGTMALAIEGRPADREQAIMTIHAALDAGVRYLDTAWSYYLPSKPGTGEPDDMGYGEYLVRDALASWNGPRDEVLVATKTGWLRTLDSEGNYGWQADARPETMIANAKESALRLGVDAIDLLYSHCNDPQVPYEDQMGALKQLVDEGVAKTVGISRIGNADIATAHRILGSRLVAVQNQFSPVHRDPEHTMATCSKLGLAFVCWSPLGGFLDPFNEHLFDRFREIAAAHDCSYQRITLAWELAQYPYLFTIPSARNPHEIEDSFQAVDLRLSQGEIEYLNGNAAR